MRGGEMTNLPITAIEKRQEKKAIKTLQGECNGQDKNVNDGPG
jgi:hypothetical protein